MSAVTVDEGDYVCNAVASLLVHVNRISGQPVAPDARICGICHLRHAPICRATDGRRWPVGPLVDATEASSLRALLHISNDTWNRALREGLNDRTADAWATKLRLWPGDVWPEWIEAALSPLDEVFVDGGWRQSWLHSEPAL